MAAPPGHSADWVTPWLMFFAFANVVSALGTWFLQTGRPMSFTNAWLYGEPVRLRFPRSSF